MKEQIARYYDAALPYYRYLWSSKGIHYGFWGDGATSLDEAIIHENNALAEIAKIGQSDHVLDAGCGTGGSSIWLAGKIGASVTGISLSSDQIKEAQRISGQKHFEQKIKFLVADFCRMPFEDASFDVVWAIESACHAKKKIDFLNEAFRVLRPGGRLIVADGFLARDPQNSSERKYLYDFLKGFSLPNLAHVSEFQKDIGRVGFSNIQRFDKTEAILPSARIGYRRARIVYPVFQFMNFFGLVPGVIIDTCHTAFAQLPMLRARLMEYHVFYGEK